MLQHLHIMTWKDDLEIDLIHLFEGLFILSQVYMDTCRHMVVFGIAFPVFINIDCVAGNEIIAILCVDTYALRTGSVSGSQEHFDAGNNLFIAVQDNQLRAGRSLDRCQSALRRLVGIPV